MRFLSTDSSSSEESSESSEESSDDDRKRSVNILFILGVFVFI